MIAYSFSEQMLSILSDVSFTMLNIWFSSSPRIYNWVSILHKYSRKYITIHLNQRHSKVFKVQVILNLMGNNICCENVWDSESLVATCIFLNCNLRPWVRSLKKELCTRKTSNTSTRSSKNLGQHYYDSLEWAVTVELWDGGGLPVWLSSHFFIVWSRQSLHWYQQLLTQRSHKPIERGKDAHSISQSWWFLCRLAVPSA